MEGVADLMRSTAVRNPNIDTFALAAIEGGEK